MKKILASISVLMLMSSSVFAGIGVSLQALYYDASGQETLKESSKVTNKSDSGVAPLGSIFMEGETSGGQVLGLEIVPYSAKIADGSMTNDDDAETSGTNSVDVKLSNMISLYVEQPVNTGLDGSFIKAAVSHVKIETDETVSTGSTYGNEAMNGLTLGFGVKNDLPNTDGYYKVTAEVSHFEGATFNSENTANKIELDDFQTAAIRFSIGF